VCELTDLDIPQEWEQNSSTFFKIVSQFGILSYLPLTHQILAQITLSVSAICFDTNIQQQIYGDLKASLQWWLHTLVSGIMYTHLSLWHFLVYRIILWNTSLLGRSCIMSRFTSCGSEGRKLICFPF
jgi:hypothetical protein